jgi:hypothetical protein
VSQEISEAWRLVRQSLYSITEKHWQGDHIMQQSLGRLEFVTKVEDTTFVLLTREKERIRDIITAMAALWTETRERVLTDKIQAADEADTIKKSDLIRMCTLKSDIFQNIDPKILEQHEFRIRSLCAEEKTVGLIAMRCWREFHEEKDEDVAAVTVNEHLTHYGDIKTIVLDKLVSVALTTILLEEVDDEYRKQVGRHLLKT